MGAVMVWWRSETGSVVSLGPSPVRSQAQRPPAAADQRPSGPPAAAPFPSIAGPAYAQVEMVDMVIGKVVAKVWGEAVPCRAERKMQQDASKRGRCLKLSEYPVLSVDFLNGRLCVCLCVCLPRFAHGQRHHVTAICFTPPQQ